MKMTRVSYKFRLLTCLIPLLIAVNPASAQAPKRITQAEALDAAVEKTQPQYPPVARQMKIQGVVEAEVSIDETGKVEKVQVVKGNAMLTPFAAEALKKWRFTPFTEGGKPVKAVAPMTVSFKL